MNIVVTGANGFIGKNLCVMLREQGYQSVFEVTRETSYEELVQILRDADFVYHLAGVNRPKDDSEFQKGNTDFTESILKCLRNSKNNVSIAISSSGQAAFDNAYGLSKRLSEKAVEKYALDTGASHYIYRLPNVFGKWCKPNYNSFVATFCYNTLNELNITIHDRTAPVKLVYIDDVCADLISLIDGTEAVGLKSISPEYTTTVGEVADVLRLFKDSRSSLVTEDVGSGLVRALYSTYLSYMRPDQFSYPVPSYGDERGVFSEMLKTKQSGQISFFTAHPGITRGGHYHHTKTEKFLVLKGKALFKFEHISTGERFELETDGVSPQIVETVPGWSHDITNVGDEEMIVMLWANEIFDRDKPDTYSFDMLI